ASHRRSRRTDTPPTRPPRSHSRPPCPPRPQRATAVIDADDDGVQLAGNTSRSPCWTFAQLCPIAPVLRAKGEYTFPDGGPNLLESSLELLGEQLHGDVGAQGSDPVAPQVVDHA